MPKISTPTLQRDPVSGVIYIHWTEPTDKGKRGRSRRASTGTREMGAAKTYLGTWLLEDQNQPAGQSFTVGELWSLYNEKHVQTNTVAPGNIESSWKNLEPHFGGLSVDEVTQDVADAYQGKRARGAIGRPSRSVTVRKEMAHLAACLRWAVEREIIPKAPKLKRPPDAEPRDRWLRENELTKLMAAAAGGEGRMSRVERFLWLALTTAGRKAALCELTWDRVDFQTNVVDLNKPGRRKTKKRRAVVPIAAALRPVLLRAYEERESDFVLDHEGGRIDKDVKRVAKAAGVAGVSPHVLRHTAATHMARRGVPLWLIAKILGNTLAQVERTYAKHCPDDLRPAVEAIYAPALPAITGATT